MVETGNDDRRLLDKALRIYEEQGWVAVHRWGQEQELPLRLCALCEIETPFVVDTCMVCWCKGSGNG